MPSSRRSASAGSSSSRGPSSRASSGGSAAPRSLGHSSLTLRGLSFAWPDGTLVLDRLDAAFPPGRTGLIGLNGAGKTTLVRILAGELTPTAGSVEVPSLVAYVRQDLTLARPDPARSALAIDDPKAAGRTPADGTDGGRTPPAEIRADWAGADRTLVGQIVGDGTGGDGTGADRTLADRAGADRAGADRAGADRTVADLLGVGPELRVLDRVDAGTAELADFDLLDGRWDVPERARAQLGALGLQRLGLDRPADTLSGGEVTLVALAAAVLAEPDVLLLDEPTNNLDRSGRERLAAWLAGWSGPVVVVSHDRELLAHVDQIAELHPPGQTAPGSMLQVFGGGFDDYTAALAVEAAAGERAVRTAEADLRRQRREQADMRIKLDRRQRTAKAAQRSGGVPRIVAGGLKRAAEVSAGKLADRHAAEVQRAGERLTDAADRVRDDDRIRVNLPDTTVPASRDVLITHDLVLRNGVSVALHLRGPERVGVTGPNGVGKTTLVDTLTGAVAPRSGSVRVMVPLRVLPQRMRLLADELPVLAAVEEYARGLGGAPTDAGGPTETGGPIEAGGHVDVRGPTDAGRLHPGTARRGSAPRPANGLRAELARFLLNGDTVQRPVRTLSGGERFRATLAALLLAEPAPQLLVLDEPTNNLDLDSVAQLVSALGDYRGALLVISHDEPFLAEIGLDRRVELATAGERRNLDVDEH